MAFLQCAAFSGDNMNSNFGGISCSGNQNVFHVLKCELKKESVLDVQQTSFTTVYSMEQSVDTECSIMKAYNYISIYIQ
jgi:hypothetical protein